MRKFIGLLVLIVLIFSLTGCKEKNQEETTETTTVETTTQEETTVSQWPENEYTGIVPKPEFGVLNGAVEIEGEFYVTINESEISEVKAYVEILKTFGFIENTELIDKEPLGIDVYSYSAESISGYKILVEYAMKVCSVTITKII